MNPVDKLVCINCKRDFPRVKSLKKAPDMPKTCPWCRKPTAARQSMKTAKGRGR